MRAVTALIAVAACSAPDADVPPAAQRFPEQQVARWITTLQGDHGFGVTGGDAELHDRSDFVLGEQSVWLQTAGRGAPATLFALGLPAIDVTGGVPKIWIKLDDVQRATTLELWLGSDRLANAFVFPFTSRQAQRWTTEGDWVAFTLPWSLVRTVGAPDPTAITDVAWRIADDATGPVRLHVNGLGLVSEPAHGIVSFTFDDNLESIYLDAAPVLAAYGFGATAYVIAESVDQPGRATLDELHQLQDAGWEIAAHAYAAATHAAELQSLAPADVEADLVAIRDWLRDHDFHGYDHLAYPHGGFAGTDTDVLAIVRKYFATARTIVRSREVWPPSDPEKLRVFYVTDVTPLAEALAAVDLAAEHHEWIVFVFHRLVAGPPVQRTEWAAGDFAKLVEHVRASGMPVETMGQVVEEAQ
ncbi:MAG TPA: polysaccharide deacetylase family protein [Kofleriaceae bacterium]|nr:polysaccharide deacetylase family protein [Kofleriaceae bacterium]